VTKTENKAKLEAVLKGVNPMLDAYTGTKGAVQSCGWRIEKNAEFGEGLEEWIQFSGWDDLTQHTVTFRETAEGKKYYAAIGPYLEQAVSRNARRFEL